MFECRPHDFPNYQKKHIRRGNVCMKCLIQVGSLSLVGPTHTGYSLGMFHIAVSTSCQWAYPKQAIDWSLVWVSGVRQGPDSFCGIIWGHGNMDSGQRKVSRNGHYFILLPVSSWQIRTILRGVILNYCVINLANYKIFSYCMKRKEYNDNCPRCHIAIEPWTILNGN